MSKLVNASSEIAVVFSPIFSILTNPPRLSARDLLPPGETQLIPLRELRPFLIDLDDYVRRSVTGLGNGSVADVVLWGTVEEQRPNLSLTYTDSGANGGAFRNTSGVAGLFAVTVTLVVPVGDTGGQVTINQSTSVDNFPDNATNSRVQERSSGALSVCSASAVIALPSNSYVWCLNTIGAVAPTAGNISIQRLS